MYLKNLELVGFKSFADRTRLEFDRGMTAIVGPNGCGKSNISDAIRWVLGEQRARLLRGTKMQDCIFNGTDTRKALGMAEVKITLADCESALGTDYNEVTVSRRVFRSGEGQYFINKTPCRLKDIQRLFMGTGIGTNSYSLMEQGKIDLILSSKPEDRRAVFEEASGITKYKADKKEAIRKLEHTEANLQRLNDIVKEVKRQIISLQRQAGKAKRYQKLHEELRRLDIFVSRRQLSDIDAELGELQRRITEAETRIAETQRKIAEAEDNTSRIRRTISDAENSASEMRRTEVELKADLERNNEAIRVDRERIVELRALISRDTTDMESSRQELESSRNSIEKNKRHLDGAEAELTASEKELNEANRLLADNEQSIDDLKQTVSSLQEESFQIESGLSRHRNELARIEHEERAAVFQRERLEAEKANLLQNSERFEKRNRQMTDKLDELQKQADTAEQDLAGLFEERNRARAENDTLSESVSGLQRELAAAQGQMELLSGSAAKKEGYSSGAGLLLDEANPLGLDTGAVVGALAEMISTEPDYQLAIETVLRSWIDAVVVSDVKAGMAVLHALLDKSENPVRLLSLPEKDTTADRETTRGDALRGHVSSSAAVEPLLDHLLQNVYVVTSLQEIPPDIPANAAYVTMNGCLVKGDGALEFWTPASPEDNPLTRRHVMNDLETRIESLESRIYDARSEMEQTLQKMETTDTRIEEQRKVLEERRHAVAIHKGEAQIVSREADQARERLDTVRWELENLDKQGDSTEAKASIAAEMKAMEDRRNEIKATIGARNEDLAKLEVERKRLTQDVMQKQLAFSQKKQKAEYLRAQYEPLLQRISQLEQFVTSRTEQIQTYEQDVENRRAKIAEAEQKNPRIHAEMEKNTEALQETLANRRHLEDSLETAEHELKTLRNSLEQSRETRSSASETRTGQRIKRQNLMDRITSDYKISADAIQLEPEPEWSDAAPPDPETQETTVAELRAKLEAMGQVNLIAIEEYKELEERYAFLNQQHDDLVKSRQQLLEMIRKINQTTSEMFSTTFDKINENFQSMFKRLFGGGNAKLMMIDDEDPLECGIEIIAKPPGKSLKSVSLLSGGERTMTAVALLFSIYMVRPSPFCVLDELDAALDEANIQRFVTILKGFLEQSQFVVITHNKQTIATADILYGVTMQERGVSSIVSMRFNDAATAATPVPEEAATAGTPQS